MTITLELGKLASRVARKAVAGNSGVRRIAVSGIASRGEGTLLETVYNAVEKFGQSLMQSTLGFLGNLFQLSFTNLWSLTVSAGLFLANFNWNATDEQLDQQIKQAEIALAGARGALKGGTLGWVICGVTPAAAIAVFNQPLALYVLKNVGEEAAEEIAGYAANFINLTLQKTVKSAFIEIYKNYRSILRPAALGVAQLLVNAGVLSQDVVDKANKNRNEPWTFAGALEDTIDEIKDPIQQAEAEEFWEELGEACIEAGYVVAGSLDSYFAQQKLANENILGNERTIEILLDREADNASTTN